MWRSTDAAELDERAMRSEILAFLDVYCRGMTLADAREWYAEAFSLEALPINRRLNQS